MYNFIETIKVNISPVKDLKKSFYSRKGLWGREEFQAVKGVSFQLAKGKTLGLVGESGSGKTTVGRAAIGLLPISGGSINLVGRDISKASQRQLREVRQHTGIVFQDPGSSLNPRLPIGESIGEPLFLAREAKGAELDSRVEDLLDSVELPRSYRNRYPHELSGGQRQRVGIARALALTPDLLIASVVPDTSLTLIPLAL
mgnify:CR=1 FL=1